MSYRAKDVRAQQPVRLLVTEDLHHAVCVIVGLGSAVGREGELAHLVWDTLQNRVMLHYSLNISYVCVAFKFSTGDPSQINYPEFVFSTNQFK